MNFASKRAGWGATLVFVAALGLASCRTPPAPKPETPVVAKEFVGDAECVVCHAKEAKTHQGSHHARTLQLVTGAALGSLLPPLGPIPRTGFALVKNGDGLAVGAPGQSDTLPLSLALGSGKTGITFVGMVDGGRMVELRQSYFPSKKSWYTTPGQEAGLAADDVGKVHGPDNVRKCIGCHAVAVPESGAPEPKFFGVGCEACHGPGSAHVAASKVGDYDRYRPENLARLTGHELGKKCGVCHGQVEEVGARPNDRKLTNRFQVYGLEQSACFQKSAGKLSCSTCHSPHADAGKDPKPYEAVCVKCHTAPQNKPCPVQPKTDCVKCHMPSRPAVPGTALPTLMADHWIRSYPRS